MFEIIIKIFSDEEVKCPFCNRVVKRRILLNAHIREVHIRDKKFKCVYCKKTFVRKYHLKRHLFCCKHSKLLLIKNPDLLERMLQGVQVTDGDTKTMPPSSMSTSTRSRSAGSMPTPIYGDLPDLPSLIQADFDEAYE